MNETVMQGLAGPTPKKTALDPSSRADRDGEALACAVARARRALPMGEAELVPECNHAMVSDQTELVRGRLMAFFGS